MENSEVYGKFVLTVYANNIDFVAEFCLAIKQPIKQTLLHNFRCN